MTTTAEIESRALAARNESGTVATGGGVPHRDTSPSVVYATDQPIGKTLADWMKWLPPSEVIPTRTQFWTNVVDGYPTPSELWRMRERVFIGQMADSVGERGGSDASTFWFLDPTKSPNYVNRDAQLSVVSDNGLIAIAAASRASDRGALAGACIGLASFVDADSSQGWAGYFETWRGSSGFNAQGIEIDVRNTGANGVPKPYAVDGNVSTLWCVAGVEYAALGGTYCGAVLAASAFDPLASFHVGVVFAADSLSASNGYTAMAMPVNYKIRWYSPDNTVSTGIFSLLGDTDPDWVQYWSGNKTIFARNNSTENAFAILGVTSAVNYIQVSNNTTGGPALLYALGTDTDVHIRFVPQGAGNSQSVGSLHSNVSLATPAGGTAGKGVMFGTGEIGVFFGSGTPSLAATKGSLYLRTDGGGVNDRMYVNTNGSTTWTAVITVA